MIFVANDSLSELVWSPHKGLSIRCTVGISISTSKNDNKNMTMFQSSQERESGSFGSMNTSLRVNNIEDDTVAVNEAIESNSQGQEDGRLRNISPVEENFECVAENDLRPPGQFRLEVCEISKAAPITALASEAKGKEKKRMSNDDLNKEASQDDDSYESLESCNSAKQFSGGKKRGLSFNEELIVKSKRLKLQIRENPGSSSFNRSNSSFSNWISAMVTGLSRAENEKKGTNISSSREKDKASDNKGFQSLFQSIYRPSPKVEDQRLLYTDDTYQRGESCKLLKLAEKSGEAKCKNLGVSNSDDLLALKDGTGKKDDHLSSLLISHFSPRAVTNSGQRKQVAMGNVECDAGPSRQDDHPASVKKDDHLSSLFISHFSPRPVTNSGQQKQVAMGNVECDAGPSRLLHKSSKNVELQGSSSEEPTNSSSFKKLNSLPLEVEAQNINQIEHCQGFQSSEAMVSIFAKRLDAIKNIMPTDLTDKSSASATTCFFCGLIGHDLRYCPKLTETEVDELLRNMAAYGGKEESPCLCIRCFQLNHWAVACPNTPSLKKNKVDDGSSGEIWYRKGYVRNLSLHVNLEMKENEESIEKVSPNIRKVSEENASQLPWFPYPCGSLAMPKGIFAAVRSLRLSRTDIMKWMNSIFSTSLDGYYLRLRQKSGDGLGGTQYNVACICSSQEGTSAETSKGPIYVTMGGIRCSVESQYISNQDFLEDELKAWWSATLRGDHGKIPSEEELKLKVEERRRLGL